MPATPAVPQPNPDDLVSAHELARYFRVSLITIRRQTYAGIFPFIKIGRVTRYRFRDVLAAIEAQDAR